MFPFRPPFPAQGSVGVRQVGGRPALGPERIQGLGGGHRRNAAPPPPPPPPLVPPLPLSTEPLPPPLGACSKYWSPSVEPGGTVILAPATAGARRQTAKTPEIANTFKMSDEAPAFTSLPYRGIGAPVRNRIEAGLAALRENPADPAIWLGTVALIVYLSLRAGGYDAIPGTK